MPIFFDITHHHHTRVCNIWTHSAGSHLKSINDDVKKSIAILTYKQWLLSMDRKTKIVHSACPKYQHKHLTYNSEMWHVTALQTVTFELTHSVKKLPSCTMYTNHLTDGGGLM